MFTRPNDLTDTAVTEALHAGWGSGVRHLEYVPLGFGSYHWRADCDDGHHFVTADDLVTKRRSQSEPLTEPRRRLRAALWTARRLRDAGMTFVIAPTLTSVRDVLLVVDDRFAIARYPFVDGETHEWGSYPSRAERLAVLDLITALHSTDEAVRPDALLDDLAIPSRDALLVALDDLDGRWDTGPFGEPARRHLARHAASVPRALRHYDRLATTATSRPERWVLTHGEPHRGNTITTSNGTVLIDWDTVLVAPPERDLWSLADEDPDFLVDYEATAGVTPDRDALDLYRLWWDLTEVALYVDVFRQPHVEAADTAMAWEGLTRYLDPTRWPVAH